MRSAFAIGLAALSSILLASPSAAQMTAGEIEYQQACASCHGVLGKGDGPVAGVLEVEVPDLTKIKERHNGEFPFYRLMQMIDGRSEQTRLQAHGDTMPVWGSRFMADSLTAGSGTKTDIVIAEINTYGRLASLVYYLESLQE